MDRSRPGDETRDNSSSSSSSLSLTAQRPHVVRSHPVASSSRTGPSATTSTPYQPLRSHALANAVSSTSATPFYHPPFQPSNLSTAQSASASARPPTHSAVTTVSSSDASSSTGVRRRLSNPPNVLVAQTGSNAQTGVTSPTFRHPRRASLFTPAEDLGIGSSSTTITYTNPLTWFGAGSSANQAGASSHNGMDAKGKRKKSSEDFDKDYASDRSRDSSSSSSKKRVSHPMSTHNGRLTSDSDGSPPLHPVKLAAYQSSLSNRPSYSNMSLTPLPQDPNNILPLSLPSTPYATPSQTPGVSPHPSMSDIKDYISYNPSGSGSSSSAGPSSNRSPSPRTSMSTSTESSYDPSRSDSRSSISGDEAAPMLRSAGWWARTGQPRSTLRAARSRMISLPPIPTGTRSWGWLMGLLPLRSASTSTAGKLNKTRRFRSRRDTIRERERLISKAKQRESITGVYAIDRCLESLPAKPMTIILSLLAFAAFALFTTVTLKHVLNPDKAPLPWRTYCSASHPTVYSLQPIPAGQTTSYFGDSSALSLAPMSPSDPNWPYPSTKEAPSIAASLDVAPVGVFVGVFTTDSKVERRNMIRQSYGSHPRSRRSGTEGVKVTFIMGRPRRSYLKAVQLEMEAFGDILLLDMPENMNSGKTHAFFTWAADYASVPDVEYVLDDSELLPQVDALDDVRVKAIHKGERKPDYVVKADDDSFIMLGELERRLRVAPRTKAYWGYLVKNSFMAGEAYGLSMDLVNYIATSPRVRSITRGKEDKLVSKWMRMHPQATEIAWVTEKCWIYDHPKAGTVYSHGFLFPSTVAQVRLENVTGLDQATIDARGGSAGEAYQSFSSVSRFNVPFRPLAHDLSAGESVESLIEGSQVSLLDPRHRPHGSAPDPLALRGDIRQTYAERPSRKERFLQDERELGGTVVIHYIKKAEWFVETWLALLGGVDEEDGRIPITTSAQGSTDDELHADADADAAGGLKLNKGLGL